MIIVMFAVITALIGWSHVSDRRRHRRRLEVLGASACPACGTCYGAAAAERARQDYLAARAEAHRKYPNCKINFAHYWEIRCASCGAQAR